MSFENDLIDNCTIFTTDNFATFQFDAYCVLKDLNKNDIISWFRDLNKDGYAHNDMQNSYYHFVFDQFRV